MGQQKTPSLFLQDNPDGLESSKLELLREYRQKTKNSFQRKATINSIEAGHQKGFFGGVREMYLGALPELRLESRAQQKHCLGIQEA